MKIEKGKTYYIEAMAKGIVFFPNSRCYSHGQEVKGNLDGSTLLLVQDALEILEIKEVKNTRDVKPKVKEETKVEVPQEPEPIAQSVEQEFEDMLKED